MRGKLLQNLSANWLQLIVNQLFGILIFFILSTHLNKQLFGQLNLVLAILLTAFNLLSFGIDQLIVSKAASGESPQKLLSFYLTHVFITGSLFYIALFALTYCAPLLFAQPQLLLFIGTGKLLLFFSVPFKQLAAGLERFKVLSWMSIISNTVRAIMLLVLTRLHMLTIDRVAIIFIAGDAAELLFTVILFKLKLKIPVGFNWNFKQYMCLVKEALPQLGVVIFTSALARFDWIFIGFMVSSVKLAEYSFAYKIFEISTLPLLALAPLLVPRFTIILKNNTLHIPNLQLLLKLEMALSVFVSLMLFLNWQPLIDWITAGKYGAVNTRVILILSVCMPLLYINNFFWSINFAGGRLKMILTVIMITFVINLLGDILLIPVLKNEGAAIAYLLAMLVQCAMYIKKNNIYTLNNVWQPLLICVFCALLSAFITSFVFKSVWIIPVAATFGYLSLLFIFKQIRFSDYKTILQVLN